MINSKSIPQLLATGLLVVGLHSSTMGQMQPDYQEKHRPQFHFSPPQAWMNDPNGMVYYEGEYHLFYQYYPYASVWGPMHWGHAVSTDLVHWENLPVAIYPDEHGLIFSGSAVVDWKNTSGFGQEGRPPMVAIFTYHNMIGEKTGRDDFQTQGIAYSNDRGRSWTVYEGNPVLPNQGIRDFRDPKVLWHEPTSQWVMVLSAKDRVQFYRSPDLKQWSFASEFGKGSAPELGVWECPDLFPLRVDGNGEEKWVMIVSHGDGGPNGGSCTRYFIGDFDGKEFKSDHPVEQLNWLDYGKDNYAGVTWSDVPQDDGRRIFIGWMSNWQYATKVPTTKWRSTMTLARTLELRRSSAGLLLHSMPVRELDKLRGQGRELTTLTIDGKEKIRNVNAAGSEVELTFDLASSDSKSFGVEVSNSLGEHIRISVDQASSLIIVDRSNAGKMSFSDDFPGLHYIPYQAGDSDDMTWRLFIDNSSLELFVNDGAIVVTDIFFPTEDMNTMSLFAFDGKARLKEGKVYDLKGIW